MEAEYPAFDAHIKNVLPAQSRPQLVGSVLPTVVKSIDLVSKALRHSATVSQVGTSNAFGDDQLNVDVLAEQIIRAEIAQCPSIATASSEEEPTEKPAGESRTAGDETYTLAFDPLDGSSIIGSNWTVGAIIGIWDGETALRQDPSEKQIAAVLGVFGPRTSAIVAIRLPGQTPLCFEVGLGEANGIATCEMVRPTIELLKPPFKTRYFAPANLRSAAEDKRYAGLITHFIQSKYTLRYSGGLVPDIVHALVKGHGLYVSPVTSTSKPKLRRLYELAPIALIMECVGGAALDPATGRRILADPIKDTDERAGLLCGTAEEVEYVKEAFGLMG